MQVIDHLEQKQLDLSHVLFQEKQEYFRNAMRVQRGQSQLNQPADASSSSDEECKLTPKSKGRPPKGASAETPNTRKKSKLDSQNKLCKTTKKSAIMRGNTMMRLNKRKASPAADDDQDGDIDSSDSNMR